MFLINKKRGVSCFVLLISFFKISAQELPKQEDPVKICEYKRIVIGDKFAYLPIYPKKDPSLFKEHDDDHIKEAYSAHWDTEHLNPYWDEQVSFPFLLKFGDEKFSSPVSRKMVVTSRYGWRRGRPHKGIDIDLQTGDEVKSILDGKIRYVGYYRGYGNMVIVRHYNGIETLYAHLSELLVRENQEVKKGAVIGKGGVSGNARGSHLHLEVSYHGKTINPEYVFEFSNETEIRSDTFVVTKKWATPRRHRSTRKSNVVVYKTMDDVSLVKEQQQKFYTVKKGDTLYRIANKHGLAVSELCKANSIKRNSVLKIGQQIIVN